MSSDVARTTYHHGDARNALLRAAAELLEQTGAAGLSLRQVAERAGLSRQAPYNHFADKEALLAELVRDGYERLGRGTAIAHGSSRDPMIRLARGGESYIAFAQGAPALFRLMFSKELVDLSRHPAAHAASVDSYGRLAEVIATMVAPEAVEGLSLAAWSMVHGYATLCLEKGLESPEQRHTRAHLFAQIIAAAAKSSKSALLGALSG